MPVLGASGGASFYGSTTTATASGAIADGDPVILNADGTVSSVTSQGVEAGNAGSRFFLVGATNDAIYQYSLSTDYNVSTASYSGVNFSIASQETSPNGVVFDTSGYKMYIVGFATDAVYQYALGASYDVGSASYTGKSFSIASQDNAPRDLAFNSDGTKMFVVGSTSDAVFLYDLSTGFDISTASYSGTSFSVASQSTVPVQLKFSPDGTKMYILEYSGRTVYQYTLTTGFDLTTASYASKSFNVGSQDTGPIGLDFSTDGTKMYMVGLTNDTVYEYDLSTAFDVSTASYSTRSFSVAAQDGVPYGLKFCGTIYGSNLTSADEYLGISDGAYADGATATIQLVGSTDDAQTGLTAGETYYVQIDGTLSTTPNIPEVEAGYAISPTEIVVKGAYSTVTGPEYKPTPLADAVPQMFQASYNLLDLYYSAAITDSSTANFWTAIDKQGAYIAQSVPKSYVEIVNVTGSGMLGTIITGAISVNADVFIEVTIDNEVREWRIFTQGGRRGILTFSPKDGWATSSGMLSSAPANFDSVYTTAYSTRDTTTNTSDDIYLSPAILSQGIRFKINMKVRIKSATAFYTGSFLENHGALYVID